ncbi:TPA: hypothetical protein N0F65_005727 [Lagenidium giganteum]|uniref:Uncharacterized protein n=1 Tax=Lagenidium giganteum TaxID=4803 RepID=A0AAV2ZF23_9STRA|nr:TPA: hypothetical protein N0F65_005727 [Lagenidium giganteum]
METHLLYEFEGRLPGCTLLQDTSTFALRLDVARGIIEGEVRRATRSRRPGGVKRSRQGAKRRLAALVAHIQGQILQLHDHPHDENDAVDHNADAYVCAIEIVKRKQRVDRHTVCCAFRLPKTDAGVIHGTWQYAREQEDDDVESRTFTLESTAKAAARRQQLLAESSLALLSPGTYELSGFIQYDHLPKSHREECTVTLKLLPNGQLRGFSRELVHPQVSSLRGTWDAATKSVRYVLLYEVRGEVGHFQYDGKVKEAQFVKGRWRNVDRDHAEGYSGGKGNFQLELLRVIRDNKPGADVEDETLCDEAATINVADVVQDLPGRFVGLTAGHYTLHGRASDDDGYEYECVLQLELKPCGVLTGTMQEKVVHQVCPIEGSWTRQTILYRQQYVVEEQAGTYEYGGTLDLTSTVVNGRWGTVLSEDLNLASERGTFAFAITDAVRQWSPEGHLSFPKPFRSTVLCLLLCSLRKDSNAALPTSVWCHVISFCDGAWFPSK